MCASHLMQLSGRYLTARILRSKKVVDRKILPVRKQMESALPLLELMPKRHSICR